MTRKTIAFAVHILTASGAVWALLATVAAARWNWTEMFFWLGLALFVDAIDGPLARALSITETLPRWDGGAVDFVIDYASYVFIPAFALTGMGLMPTPLAYAMAALIVFSGAFYYGDTHMKAPNNSFVGFPVVWNAVVFHLAVYDLPAWANVAVIVALTAATFLPVHFIHPVRVQRWWGLTMTVAVVWSLAAIATLFLDMRPPQWLAWVLGLSALYLLLVGAAIQLLEKIAITATGR